MLQGCRLLKRCCNLSVGHCAAGVQQFKHCHNLVAGTVLQGCSCLSSVKTYLPILCSRAAGSLGGVANYLPGTVLQLLLGDVTFLPALCCSCLSGVATFLPALCCRGAAV